MEQELVRKPDGWEQTVIHSVLAGDTDAFSGIIVAYESRLRSFCRSRLPESEISDTMQDIFLKAFRSIKTYNPKWHFSTWFFTIANSTIASKKFHFKKETEKVRRVIAYGMEPPQENEGQEELEKNMIREMVSMLCSRNKKVVELYYFAGLGISEVAKVLAISEAAVKTRLFRARKELLEILEKRVTRHDKHGYTHI